MSPSENEEDAKKTVPPPLCLFCFPDDFPLLRGKTYIDTLQRERVSKRTATEESLRRFAQDIRQKEKEEFWLRKRTEARIRRRRMKEPIRNLKSYLLASVKNDKTTGKSDLPSLYEVLETVKDAWPSPTTRNKILFRNENPNQPKMKNEQIKFPGQLLNRRLSMPEELIRKYSVSKEKTSEESETNKTAIEVSPSSSSTIETARRREIEVKPPVEKSSVQPKPEPTVDAYQQTSDSDEGKRTDLSQRVTQSDYYKQGKRIIKVRDKCTCDRESKSSTTVSAKDETDDSATTESVLSSSPTQLPKRESSSGNLSSESDNIRCTCAELSSKETSTDLYLSGKSTLSQTVSDKSMSTQDSTVSVNSVSSRGSTVSYDSNSTTPELERTSAKETTTSPDYSPRTPRNRKNRRREKHLPHGTCPRHSEAKHSRNNYSVRCPIHSPPRENRSTANAATNTDCHDEEETNITEEVVEISQNEGTQEETSGERYKWAKLSQEELYMMQQLRHRRFIESQRKLSSNLPPTPDADSITTCGTGSAYNETEGIQQAIMIPRYSALPRSLSMLVNTSSPDSNSDSDNQSLADSLEDQPVTHKLYFDTKKESKPVRGDVNVVVDNKLKHRQPRGRAFFVSMKEPYGEDELLEHIEKIPQPPEKIKNQIFKRHLRLCAKHKRLHHPEDPKEVKTNQKNKKGRNEIDKTPKGRKISEDCKKMESERKRREDTGKVDSVSKKKEGKGRSKIPVLLTTRSTSSSPERDSDTREKPTRPKPRLRRDKETDHRTDVETTQILEITHTGTELTLQKPQAVIHPSQIPSELKTDPPLVIPPLVSTLKIPPFRQSWNKPLAPLRRSPIGKFRQRFEVIPEEKSSSLSSAEEKNGRETLPKFADASTSPTPSEKIHFQSYNVNEVPNLIVAKITNKQLETLPYVNSNDNQKIILFSSKPQNSNSSKGRDALIAMNREDFNRLAKGWMNFYKLNENMENSETEGKAKGETQKLLEKDDVAPQEKKREAHPTPEVKSEKLSPLDENIRFDCSNTILRSEKAVESNKSLFVQEEKELEEEETDSDSTDYMEPPSPRVPPLPIDDIPSDGTLSSSDNDLDPPKPQITTQSLKCLHPKRRSITNRTRALDTSRCGKKKNSGWSVTVAGTVELSRSAPDLEMRLSFPASGGPPLVSQSDSGFAEDSNYSKLSESLQELDSYTERRELPFGQGNTKQKWMVTVKNPKSGKAEDLRKQFSTKSNHHLPDLEPARTRNPQKVLKDPPLEDKLKRLVERKMTAIWPKVQRVIQNEFLTDSGRLITELDELDDGSCLSVRGSAVSMERKQKPPTMTERDVTRRYTSRPEEFPPENLTN